MVWLLANYQRCNRSRLAALRLAAEREAFARAARDCFTIESRNKSRLERNRAVGEAQRPFEQRRRGFQKPVHFTCVVDAVARDARFHPAADLACDAVAEHRFHAAIAYR